MLANSNMLSLSCGFHVEPIYLRTIISTHEKENFFTKYPQNKRIKTIIHFCFLLFSSCKPNSFSINVVGISLDTLCRAVRNHVNLLFGADYL